MTDPNHIAEARKKVSRPQIREAFLRNGACIESDRDDLPDYVYESVFELLEMAAPDVQGELVANNSYWYGMIDRYLRNNMDDDLYEEYSDALGRATAPQPAPDVAGLVEALESLIKGYVGLLEAGMDRITSLGGDCDPVPVMEQNDPWLRDARAALAAHRKGGDHV